MSGVRRQRLTIAWLVVVALLSNALAFGLHRNPGRTVDHGLGPMVICTADGTRTIPADNSTGGGATDHCPACRLQVAFVLPVPILDADMAFRVEAASPPIPTGVGVLPIPLRLGGIRSRAPPLSA
jgi:hypothetical protein